MKLTLTLILLVPFISFAQIDTILSSNVKRTYKLQLPNEYNKEKNYPIIFVLHGYYHENLGMPEYSGFDKFVDRDCIVVYPHGLKEEKGINYFWNSGGGLSQNYGGVNDVKFIENLIDELPKNYSINKNKVYIVGHSNGGMMAYRIAMELSHKITAMANLAGSMMFDNITPKFPVPILHIHGTKDPAVLITGFKHPKWAYLAIDDVLNNWIKWNKCKPEADTLVNSKSYLHLKWGDNKDNIIMASYIKDAGHDWLQISKNGFNIAENIWSFFNSRELYSLKD